MEDLNVMDEVAKMVRELSGNSVGIHTADCVEWKLEHKDCVGCKHELGCSMVSCVGLLMLTSSILSEKMDSLDATLKLQCDTAKKIDQVLSCKTRDEVKSILGGHNAKGL